MPMDRLPYGSRLRREDVTSIKEVGAAGSVSQPDLRRPQLAQEFGLGEEFLRRAVRLLEDLETDVARGDLAQGQHRGIVVLTVQGGSGARKSDWSVNHCGA